MYKFTNLLNNTMKQIVLALMHGFGSPDSVIKIQ